jgi:2-methylcitrate dehydratase PrpD
MAHVPPIVHLRQPRRRWRRLVLQLCERITRWRFEDLPADVVHKLKLFVLDTLGVIGGAAHAPGIRELNQRLARVGKHRLG